MLYTIISILFAIWVLGVLTSYTLGGLIHLVLVVAVLMMLINLIQGWRA